MIRRLLLISILSSIGFTAWSQSSLEGKVTDATSGEALIFANVILFKNGNLITGAQTDLDGNYVFSSIDPGTYDVEASYTGYPSQRQTGVLILAGKAIRLDFKLDVGLLLDIVEVIAYKVPLIEQDNTTQGGIKTAEQIRNLPTKNINAIAATTAGLSSIDGGDINIRGSRTNATNYYLDGMRVDAARIPQSEIEQLQVITGGIESRYGDVTGGLISLTSKGPSSTLSGSVEVESSELTDPYGYNLVSANLSGPVLKNKTTNQTIMGFRVSAQYRDRKDPNPRAFGGYRATEEAIDRISKNPLTYVNGTPVLLADRLEESDVELLEARPNVGDKRYDFTGKLDFKVNDAIDFTVGGTYYDNKQHFSPNRQWNLLNWQYNPYRNESGYLANVRFRHRIGGTPAGGSTETTPSIIRNISYTLQYGYEKSFFEEGDDRYKDNLFQYGYVGKFDVEWLSVVGIAQDTSSPFAKPLAPGSTIYGEHFGYGETFVEGGYTPSTTINPLLNNYNIGQDVIDFRNYNAYNGEWSDIVNSAYAGVHTATGAIYNRFDKRESDIHTGALNASFDLFPGGSEKGRHNIQFGLLYEQRSTRRWAMNPRDLWNNMRFAANTHIIGLDSNQIIGVDTLTISIDGGPVQDFEIMTFQTLVQENPSLLFYSKVRELTGQSLNEYVNIDGLDPNSLSLDMFAAEELTNRRQLTYHGYDYLGNKLGFDVTFDDFFTAEDNQQRRTLPVAANKPIYSAAYFQDKFTFRDIIFRLGLRVDQYDANTKVLKDPYSLYEIITVNDFYDLPNVDDLKPENVQDDWKVYVVSDGSTEVRAYRDGDQWYTAEGTPVNDGAEILGNEIPNPYYVEQNPANRNIRARGFRDPVTGEITSGFDPSKSFEDYKPQISWMPRLAFSFPISDEANFFVHYDILVQRPPSNTIATALDYFYWSDGPPENNPNLKPEKTIDFEVGFKQKITNSSAITLSAYYKELRDMIQSQTYLFVPGIPGNSYNSFGNQDFGTVKGFSFSYDLRRTQNLEMTAAYTLQFADGTGSSATSQVDLNINGRGNLRYLTPLSFDERHRLSTNIDYRYGSGNLYNGPRWFGLDIFSNAGISLQGNAASGRPYTKRQKPERFDASGLSGSINGARLPWNFTLDLRADKSFRIMGNENSKPLFANVYLRIENIFDARNIIGVYTGSGSAYDDGFLVTPSGQSSIQTLEDSGRGDDIDNYLLSYQWGLLNPAFFTLPRRVYLGATLQF
jgi:outer membrane receptor protein involved in Fe transport